MPVEFLSDDEVASFGQYSGPPSHAELSRMFLLDDEDVSLIAGRRGDANRLGFALQLVTVRWLGTFLDDPLDVPVVVLDFVAEQLRIDDPSQAKEYSQRRATAPAHQRLIREVDGWAEFSSVEPELVDWVAARAWTSGDGPKAIFTDAVGWLRRRKVLLPGVTTLARLVAGVRRETNERLWATLAVAASNGLRAGLERLLTVPVGSRVSDLERWRRGVTPRASGPTIVKALDQVKEVAALGLTRVGAESLVPSVRLAELARYGMRADVSALRRHPPARRTATLLATARHLEGKSVDDVLELVDLLITTELVGKARREADKDKVRRHPQLVRASARLAVAVEALFAAEGWGGVDGRVSIEAIWEAVEQVVTREQVRSALDVVNENAPAGVDLTRATGVCQSRVMLSASRMAWAGLVMGSRAMCSWPAMWTVIC